MLLRHSLLKYSLGFRTTGSEDVLTFNTRTHFEIQNMYRTLLSTNGVPDDVAHFYDMLMFHTYTITRKNELFCEAKYAFVDITVFHDCMKLISYYAKYPQFRQMFFIVTKQFKKLKA